MTALEICLALYAAVITALYFVEGRRANEYMLAATKLTAFCRQYEQLFREIREASKTN